MLKDVDDGGQPRPDFDARVTRLAEELAAEVPELEVDVVLTTVRESYTALARSARVTPALVPLTERFARQRLADLTRDRSVSMPQVLFVCVANAGRSQLAAALVNKRAAGKVGARTAESAPADVIHPHVRSLLGEFEGDRTAERFPKPLTDDAVRSANVVIALGGKRYEGWKLDDPAGQGVAAIRPICDAIRARIE